MFENFTESVKDLSENVKSKVAEKEFSEEDVDPLLEEMRLKLLKLNISLEVVERIEEEIRERLLGEQVGRRKVDEKVDSAVGTILEEVMDDSFDIEEEIDKAEEPPVIFLMGLNGSGKTTTAGKIAYLLEEDGFDTVLGAGDTFRAASIEQLEEHGENLDVEVISHEYESDPAAVAYDTVEKAEKDGKVAIVDTAGRSHSDQNLMDELEKMVRVNNPDISFLVVEAIAGNDVMEQLEAYEGIFDAIIVTKTDLDEKGGTVVSVCESSGKPVAFLGTGQEYEDLEEFDKEEYVIKMLNQSE
jgi:fused signal recognition particle receptor